MLTRMQGCSSDYASDRGPGMICKWCGNRLIVYPLAPNYCSSECKIEDLEDKLERAYDETASLKEELEIIRDERIPATDGEYL